MIRQLINLATIRQTLVCLSITSILTGCSDFLEEYSQDKYRVNSYNDLDELLLREQGMDGVRIFSTLRKKGM